MAKHPSRPLANVQSDLSPSGNDRFPEDFIDKGVRPDRGVSEKAFLSVEGLVGTTKAAPSAPSSPPPISSNISVKTATQEPFVFRQTDK